DENGGWRDPMLLASDVVHADPRLACDALADAVAARRRGAATGEWSRTWLALGELSRAAIAGQGGTETEAFEGRVFAELAALLPDGATLFAGNSMPVRDLDAYFPAVGRTIRFIANRGANGIDGVVSSALGVAAASSTPLVLVI